MHLILQFFRESIDFFNQLILNRYLIFTLSVRNFQQVYIRNIFGFVWAILDPLAFVVILYFVFQARFGDTDSNGIPFIVYLLSGYITYDFFNSSLLAVTESIHNHTYLLNKVNFRVAILPIVSVLSNLIMHGVVLAVTIIVFLFNKQYPLWSWLQIIYYIIALITLLVAVGWLTSSIYLFFPDIRNIVGIISRVLFFLTPIFWNIEGLLPEHQVILKLNPIYYLVTGYRDSFFGNVWFWQHPYLTTYFWLLTFIFLLIGVAVFKKLRPHFADVA